jgi:hypothetical protein
MLLGPQQETLEVASPVGVLDAVGARCQADQRAGGDGAELRRVEAECSHVAGE